MYCSVHARYPHTHTPGLSHRKTESGSWYPRTYLLGHIVLNLNLWPHGTRLITPLMRLGQRVHERD